MKLLKYLPALGIALVVYALWQSHQNSLAWAVWTADRTRILAQKDSALHVADSLTTLAERQSSAANRVIRIGQASLASANRLRDSLAHLPQAPDTCAIWLDVARGRADSLQVATDSLLAGIDSLRGANEALRRETLTLRQPIQSLTHLVETVPKGCRVLGFVPCPEITLGYGAMLTQGKVLVGPNATVGWRIGF